MHFPFDEDTGVLSFSLESSVAGVGAAVSI
jgi:hypothetical protein